MLQHLIQVRLSSACSSSSAAATAAHPACLQTEHDDVFMYRIDGATPSEERAAEVLGDDDNVMAVAMIYFLDHKSLKSIL